MVFGLVMFQIALTLFAGWFIYDHLKKELISRVGQIDNHLKALQGRVKDNETSTSKAFLMAGNNIKELEQSMENRFCSIDEKLEEKADNQAIDNMGDELFSVKSTLAALGQKAKKKLRKLGKRK